MTIAPGVCVCVCVWVGGGPKACQNSGEPEHRGVQPLTPSCMKP